MQARLIAIGLVTAVVGAAQLQLVMAQAVAPPAGIEEEKKPLTPEQRMQARFP